tara:strand:+ start:260 stop:619 length:360 start_codon:yes stop_codon:yes gene_type:complete
MTIQSLYHLLQSGEGFSVRPQGLLTFSGKGYAVGGAQDFKVHEVDNEDLSFIKFEKLMNGLVSSSFDPHTQVVGGWVDEGRVYLELSDIVQSKYVAMELAKARREKAIYDFANGKSIYL